ncbi:hypothetical protein BU24DRAFT_96945 [Aaosphaeria arxii CBS 175.79]|uniref:Uncharacterized protein n=1 Tax=Aaosphaeria arxii CBS 175.79 TaxID=1450172 RepID=A0A6A5X613_9PLEO|nr:uncharacterized protein BU24DRAFT_96945 [Aaosphaeria arxii CBS 175.79]KAF2008445.1 hypothetical protein BU24DRAFT_96945 [Aaosphaeria arxii CBS 175.79]
MAGFIQNILWNSVEGFVEAGTRTAGGYAGNALIKAGDLIENSGRSIGTGIERKASNYGTAITGQTYEPSGKALPSTARKPALKRSHSSPAASASTTKTKAIAGPTSKTPIGAKKAPPAPTKQVAAVKQIANGPAAGAGAGAGAGTGASAAKKKKNALPKPFPENQPYGTKAKPQAGTSKQPLNNVKAAAADTKQSNSLPKPYGGTAYPTEKKTAVKPGQSKPFVPPKETNAVKNDKKQPYPGTRTLPGQASKTPVRPSPAKAFEGVKGLGGQDSKGRFQHIAV